MKAYLCCIGRKENKYIVDFVEYYRKLGFDKIIVCDNNFDEEENFYDVLSPQVNEGFVTIENYRNQPLVQITAYTDMYRKYGSDCDWIAFFDCDEFLTLPQHCTISEYLEQEKFNGFSAIHVNWKSYGDDGKLYYESKPVYERFTTPLEREIKDVNGTKLNAHIKTIIRTGTVVEAKNSANPHTPTVIEGRICNEHGEEIDNSPWNENYDYGEAYLRHYVTKTAEEYAEAKLLDGCPDMDRDPITLYNKFFALNEFSAEKDAILKKALSNTYAGKSHIEVIYFATGDYVKYLKNFLDSIKYFFPTVQKLVRIVTNADIGDIELPCNDVVGVEVIKILDLFYPCVNLHKTYFIEQMNHDWADYIFYFDADTVFMNVPEYFWKDIVDYMNRGYFVMSVHPFYTLSDEDKYKQRDIDNLFSSMTERSESSSACIPQERYTYVISSFFCASVKAMHTMCQEVNHMIKEDMRREKGYHIPLYIDENYFNKIVYNCEYGLDNRFAIKVDTYIQLGNSLNNTNYRHFLIQKNMNKEFKTSRQ